MSSITLKISSLIVRTLSKPIASRIKAQAKEHERFRKICVSFAQSIHRFDMRLRLGLLQDPAAIDRQLAREAAEQKKGSADDKDGETAKPKPALKPRIRPLSESKAIETGANFISESFLFAVGLSLIAFESWRQRRKEKARRFNVDEKLADLEARDEQHVREIADLQRELADMHAHKESHWWWPHRDARALPPSSTPSSPSAPSTPSSSSASTPSLSTSSPAADSGQVKTQTSSTNEDAKPPAGQQRLSDEQAESDASAARQE